MGLRWKLLLANELLLFAGWWLAGGADLGVEIVGGGLLVAILFAHIQTQLINRSYTSLKRRLRDIAAADLADPMWKSPLPAVADADLNRTLEAFLFSTRQRQNQLNDEKKRLHVIIDSMTVAVLITGVDGRVVLANEALASLFDVQLPLEGRLAVEIIRQAAVQDLIGQCLDDGRRGEAQIALTGVRERFLDVQVAPIRDGDNHVGALTVLYDVTRLRQLERSRRDFVANASHELRTPLTAIKGYAETLKDGALDDPQSAIRFVEVISTHADRLSRLLNDLLDLSSLESDQLVVELAPCQLKQIVDTSIDSIKAGATAKGIVLHCDVAAQLVVLCDGKLLEQALINLLDNAVKYASENGFVSIGIRPAFKERHICIFVEDNGIGIPSTDLERIFERFYRVDKGRSRAMGGTGLGLAIVRHIVEAHGEQIRVESKLGEGTTFTVDLQLAD